MTNITEVFQETRTIFATQAAEAMEQAMDKIYNDYLPHVENDTASNVRFQTANWLERFFDGNLSENDINIDLARKYSGGKARQMIYEANKEEIIEAIGKDFQAEISDLKVQLNNAWGTF
jgi:hypothetical protein